MRWLCLLTLLDVLFFAPNTFGIVLTTSSGGAPFDFTLQPGASGTLYFDLWRANREQLEGAGLLKDRIFAAGLCSRSHPDVFHSYRAEGSAAGRMLGVIRAR